MRRLCVLALSVLVLTLCAVPAAAAPVLGGVSPPDVARSGRFQLTGSGFGASQGTSRVEIGGRAMPVTGWADTAITAYVLGDVALGATSVRVATSGGTSNPLALDIQPIAAGPEPVAWRFQMDSPYMLHRPAVAPDGTLYAQDVRGYVYALARAGELLWIVNAGGYPSGGGGEGPVSLAPDGTIFVTANPLGPEVQILALGRDGTRLWSFADTNTQGVIAGPGLGPDGNLYFVTDLGGRGVTSLTPLGSFRWSNAGSPAIEEYGQLGAELSFGPPSPGGPLQLYTAFDCRNTANTDRLFAFRAEGGGQRFAVPTGGTANPLGQRQGQPAVGADGTVYLSHLIYNQGWRLQSFDPETGAAGWAYGGDLTNTMSEPDVGLDGTIYVTRNSAELHAVKADGSRRWVHPGNGILFGPIASPAGGAIVVGGRIDYGAPGFVTVMDEDGRLLWRFDLPSETGLAMIPASRARFSPDGRRAYMGTMLPGQANGQEYSYLYAFDVVSPPVDVAGWMAGTAGLRAQPNPFRDVTTIAFRLHTPARARLRVFDARGRLVTTLLDAPAAAGPHTVRWDGRDARGRALAASTYFVRLDTPGRSASWKVQREAR